MWTVPEMVIDSMIVIPDIYLKLTVCQAGRREGGVKVEPQVWAALLMLVPFTAPQKRESKGRRSAQLWW